MPIDVDAITYEPRADEPLDRDVVTRQGLAFAGVPDAVMPQFSAATFDIVGAESDWRPSSANLTRPHREPLLSDRIPRHGERGLMQLNPEQFAEFHVEGTSTNIYDPVASIAAGWRFLAHWYPVDLRTGFGLDEFMARYGQSVGLPRRCNPAH